MFLLCKVCVAEIFGSIGRNRKKNDSLLLMVTKEYLAVSGCFPRASHSFLSMFFQNISIALVKYLDVFEKNCTKAFRAVSFFFFFRRKVCLFPRENPLLCAGTPVIILKTTDHKVTTGADWFKGVYDDYVYVAKDLDDAYSLCQKVLAKKLSYHILPYFKTKYYDGLKELFSKIMNEQTK